MLKKIKSYALSDEAVAAIKRHRKKTYRKSDSNALEDLILGTTKPIPQPQKATLVIPTDDE